MEEIVKESTNKDYSADSDSDEDAKNEKAQQKCSVFLTPCDKVQRRQRRDNAEGQRTGCFGWC